MACIQSFHHLSHSYVVYKPAQTGKLNYSTTELSCISEHMTCTVHAGLGVGVACGAASGADKNIHKCPLVKSVYDGEREGAMTEGLFKWWWVREKRRREKMRRQRGVEKEIDGLGEE